MHPFVTEIIEASEKYKEDYWKNNKEGCLDFIRGHACVGERNCYLTFDTSWKYFIVLGELSKMEGLKIRPVTGSPDYSIKVEW
jgi:hypothetical protein